MIAYRYEPQYKLQGYQGVEDPTIPQFQRKFLNSTLASTISRRASGVLPRLIPTYHQTAGGYRSLPPTDPRRQQLIESSFTDLAHQAAQKLAHY
jgi:hypothetical protein